MSDVATSNDAGEAPVKTAKQLEKEAKKAAKLAKFQEKQNKNAVVADAQPKEVNSKKKTNKQKYSIAFHVEI